MNLSPLYLRLAACAIAALFFAGAGWKLGAGHVQKELDALRAANWEQKAKGEEVARKALEQQLADATATAANNRQVMHDLQQDTVAILAKRDITIDFYRGLLADAHRFAAESAGLPKAADRPPAAGASGAGSGEEVARLLADADDECARNANRLDSLSAEIRPQL